jgi:ferredoxin
MSSQTSNNLETYISQFTESEWQDAISSLLDSIHEVDRNAVRIWFRFYPLALERYLETSADPDEAKKGLAMQGDFGLENRIDTSHSFLYGHRYWSEVKAAIEAKADSSGGPEPALSDLITEVATAAAKKLKVETGLTLSIAAVGLMTLVQVGLDKFKQAAGKPVKPTGLMAKSPDSVVSARGKDDSQGLLGFLRTVDKQFSVIHDERSGRRFQIMNDQEIASASANDRSENWQAKDARCWEGPVPVECTSASCGTCWVGILAGEEKMSDVARREQRALRVFGYSESLAEKPVIRLACQAKASGNVTIVIPPWNAVFGKKVYGNVEELELEPATTSAKALREVVKEASSGGSN